MQHFAIIRRLISSGGGSGVFPVEAYMSVLVAWFGERDGSVSVREITHRYSQGRGEDLGLELPFYASR